jgi:hypothetical protein
MVILQGEKMKKIRNILAGLCLASGVLGLVLTMRAAQGANFDKLSAEDRQALSQRFEKEIWPLMERGGKDGCVGCHSGKIVSDLRLTGKADKDFAMLVKAGFFLPDDAGSLLGRVTDPDPKRRMPPGKRPHWSDKEIAVLRDFTADLNKKQKK